MLKPSAHLHDLICRLEKLIVFNWFRHFVGCKSFLGSLFCTFEQSTNFSGCYFKRHLFFFVSYNLGCTRIQQHMQHAESFAGAIEVTLALAGQGAMFGSFMQGCMSQPVPRLQVCNILNQHLNSCHWRWLRRCIDGDLPWPSLPNLWLICEDGQCPWRARKERSSQLTNGYKGDQRRRQRHLSSISHARDMAYTDWMPLQNYLPYLPFAVTGILSATYSNEIIRDTDHSN